MTIFSRRTLQRLINENSAFLSEKQSKDYVASMNKVNHVTYPTEWEIVLLNALSKIGTVIYEPSMEGTSKPDILFKDERCAFIADIRTISDYGYHKNNNIDHLLHSDIANFFKRKGIDLNHLDIRIKGEKDGKYPNAKVKLLIPSQENYPLLFGNELFQNFVSSMKQEPNAPHSTRIKMDGIDMGLSYSPSKHYNTQSYPSYTCAYSLEKNTLMGALKEKNKQLKKTNYDGLKGIFITDGGSTLLHSDAITFGQFSRSNIINEFFRHSSTIDFVLLVRLKKLPIINFEFAQNEESPFSNQFINIYNSLNQLCHFMPRPVNMPISKGLYRGSSKRFYDYYGGWTVESKQITISSRKLLMLLAGEISQEEFFEYCGFKEAEKNYFHRMLDRGMLFDNIVLTQTEKDDDNVIFHFDGPDPAISPFRNPTDI